MNTIPGPNSLSLRQPQYWMLLGGGEPFRLLFPLGVILGLVGVLLWPAFALGWWETYPAFPHARIMIQGFLTAFVFGFLGTALPRLLEVKRVGRQPTFFLAAGLVGLTVVHLLHFTVIGDGFFLVLLGAFFLLLLDRLRHRQDTPPPGFVLVLMGMACAWLGTGLLFADGLGGGTLPAWVIKLARLMAWQGYLLLPILGIGAFLLPRFFGLPSRHAFPELMMPTPEWRRRAAFAAGCGGLILLAFFLEASGWVLWGNLLKAVTVVVYVLREVPLHKATEAKGSLAFGLRIALLALPVGFALIAAFPAWQLTFVHVVFITGFSLITLIVASRVVLGHSGQSVQFKAVLPAVLILILLVLGGLLVRVGADFWPEHRYGLYGISATMWALGVVIWSVSILPGVRYPDDE